MRRYIALVHATEAGGHGISFPDFPGCIAVERDLARAVNAAARALRLHVEGMTEERLPIPEPRGLAQIRADGELAPDLASARLIYIPLVPRDWNGRVEVEPVEVAPKSKAESARKPEPAPGSAATRGSRPKPTPPPPVALLGRRAGRVLARRIVDPE